MAHFSGWDKFGSEEKLASVRMGEFDIKSRINKCIPKPDPPFDPNCKMIHFILNLQDLKDLLLTSWCYIPQYTLRGLVETTPQQVRAV